MPLSSFSTGTVGRSLTHKIFDVPPEGHSQLHFGLFLLSEIFFHCFFFSFCLSVLIKGSSITLGSHGSQTNILTVSELGKFILFQICQHIITQFYFDMLMLGYKVRYNNFSVGIAHPHKIM